MKASERVSFGPQPRSADPYRPLVEHYAPFIAQETWFQPRSDYIVRFDADGDWRGDNNWDNAPFASTQAYVYYAVIETETHWFLIYNFFHARGLLGQVHYRDVSRERQRGNDSHGSPSRLRHGHSSRHGGHWRTTKCIHIEPIPV